MVELGTSREVHTVPAAPVAGIEEVVLWGDRVHGVVPTSKAAVLFHQAYLAG